MKEVFMCLTTESVVPRFDFGQAKICQRDGSVYRGGLELIFVEDSVLKLFFHWLMRENIETPKFLLDNGSLHKSVDLTSYKVRELDRGVISLESDKEDNILLFPKGVSEFNPDTAPGLEFHTDRR